MAPRPRRNSEPAEELNEAQEMELRNEAALIMAEDMDDSAFTSPQARREAWEAHASRLTREHREARPGSRPAMWWRVEAEMSCTPLAGSGDIPGVDSFTEFRERYPVGWSEEAAFLDQHDLLTEAERAELPPLENADS